MANQDWIRANDINYDGLKTNGFQMVFHNMPHVTFFCQAANIPGISAGAAIQPTPLHDISISGDAMIYEDLVIEFLLDKDLKNFGELNSWLRGINKPDSDQQFIDWKKNTSMHPVYPVGHRYSDEDNLYADATLHILTPKGNPNVRIAFRSIFPVSLSTVGFTSMNSDTEYLKATAAFKYLTYFIEVD